MSTSPPKMNIHSLRKIGWSLWDPIGLGGLTTDWREEPFADEYDTYLVKTANMLRNNRSTSEVVDYLCFIETDYMGLGKPLNETDQQNRLLKVVQAIANDPTVWSDGFTYASCI